MEIPNVMFTAEVAEETEAADEQLLPALGLLRGKSR